MIVRMLTSASSDVQAQTCLLLGQLAAQDNTSAAVLGGIGKGLVQILQRDLEAELDFQAYSWIGSPILSALARISEHPGGTAVIVDADIQTRILGVTESLDL
ncbi:hypothetical protein DFH09DRAFT_1099078 [Mycena vulgaris]|nr:hypothetical protein DFH09DRAFT_1099078 [Mycena vulgaris]